MPLADLTLMAFLAKQNKKQNNKTLEQVLQVVQFIHFQSPYLLVETVVVTGRGNNSELM